MKNAIAIVGAAAVLMLANSAGWRIPIRIGAEPGLQRIHGLSRAVQHPGRYRAMERPTATTNRNVNHFTGRPASGKN
jgi:hypothetical protein